MKSPRSFLAAFLLAFLALAGIGNHCDRQAFAEINNPSGGSASFGKKVLTVDAAGGSQYTTITAAVAAFTSGETILVHPGTYSDANITINGAIYFEDGANIVATSGMPIFQAALNTTMWIDGYGSFVNNGSGAAVVNFNGPLDATAQISIQAKFMSANGHCIQQAGGNLLPSYVGVMDQSASNSACYWSDSGNSSTFAGNCILHVGHMIGTEGGDYGPLFISNGNGTENWFLTVDQLDASTECNLDPANAGSRVWLTFQFLSNVQGATVESISAGGGRIYITGLKCEGQIQAGGTEAHVTLQKLNGQLSCGGSGAIINADIGIFDDTNLTGTPLITNSGANVYVDFRSCALINTGNSLFSVNGGLLQLNGGDFTAIAGDVGSAISGGTVRFNGRLDMSAVASAIPITITPTTSPLLILEPGCKLITDGTAKSVAMASGSATIISSGFANVGVGSSVTTTGSLTVVSGLK